MEKPLSVKDLEQEFCYTLVQYDWLFSVMLLDNNASMAMGYIW